MSELLNYVRNKITNYQERKEDLNNRIHEIVDGVDEDGTLTPVLRANRCQAQIVLRNMVVGRLSAYRDVQQFVEDEEKLTKLVTHGDTDQAIYGFAKGAVDEVKHQVEETKTNTLEGLAAEAMQIQDACNLSGLAIRFAEVVKELRKIMYEASENGGVDTEKVNRHAIVVMWVCKMGELSAMVQDYKRFDEAYTWCKAQLEK